MIQDCIRKTLGIETEELEVDSLLETSIFTDYDAGRMEGLQMVFILTNRYFAGVFL